MDEQSKCAVAPPLASMTMALRSARPAVTRTPAATQKVARPGVPVSAPVQQRTLTSAHDAVPIVAATSATAPARRRKVWAAVSPLGAGVALLKLLGGLRQTYVRPSLDAAGSPSPFGRVFPSLLPRKISNSGGNRPSAGGGRKPAVVWFRNDLRLHDHEPLAAANADSTSVVAVYCFDPREYGKSASGFDKTGPYRASFILEAVADLRAALRQRGSDLLVRVGRPEDVLPELVRRLGAGGVHCHGEVTYEEAQVEARVRAAIEQDGGTLHCYWGGTLHHPEDLPFSLTGMPASYGDFRQRMTGVTIREVVETPTEIKGMPMGVALDAGSIPSMGQLGFDAGAAQAKAKAPQPRSLVGQTLRGGETEALRHLQAFIDHVKASISQAAAVGGSSSAAAARPGGSNANFSSNFSCQISPWLALGCLSPRRMYQQLCSQLQQQHATAAEAPAHASGSGTAGSSGTEQGGTSWLLFELLWRDFFRFMTKKYASTGLGAAGAQRSAAAMAYA